MGKNIAAEILRLNALWEKTQNTCITYRVDTLLRLNGYETYKERMGKLSDITGTTIHAVGAWFNHYRSDVKIPFLKVCMIAKEFNVELEDLIRGEKLKYQSKFAVLSLKDDDQITVLKTFGSSEEDKERALAAGEKLAENRPEDEVYAVVLTEFDEDDNIKEDSYEIYEVWDDMSDKIIEELQD